MVLTVHHLGHSQSDRIVFLCEELDIPYELKKHERSPLLAPPELKALHPAGTAPVVQDTTSAGKTITLAETQACAEYIANVHGGGRLTVPPTNENYADYLYWLNLQNGTLQPTVSRVMWFRLAGVAEDHPMFAGSQARLRATLGQMEARLGEPGVEWLAGKEFTLADIMAVWSLTTGREFSPYDLSDYPNILAYVKRLTDRPAYRRYLKKGDPDIAIEDMIQGKAPLPFKAFRKPSL